MKRSILGVCLALVCGSAFAQAPNAFTAVDARRKACLGKAGGVTLAIENCDADALKAADQILNRTYGGWADQLRHPDKDDAADSAEILKRLVASERAWISYRDTGCSLESTMMLGGTGEAMAVGDCLYRTTRQRALDLQHIKDSR